MTAPTGTPDHATTPSATPLEQDIGQMFGDYSGYEETPDSDDSAAGTTPAEPSDEPAPEPGSEPAPVGDEAEETQREGTTPDATPAAVDDDPWKDTTPATYVVNGKTLISEDIRVFKEGGAAIRPESLPNVLSKLAERDVLSERVRTRDQEYTTLAKAAEWTDQSSGKTYTGPDAAIEMRIGNASMFAENKLLLSTITDPEQLARCLTTELVPDGRGGQTERVVFSEQALNDLKRENTLQQREIAAAIRDHFKTSIAEWSKPQPQPVDHQTATADLVKLISESANLDASLLTADDRATLAEQLPFHIKDGLASVPWQNLAKRMMTDRAAQKANAVTTASTAAEAAKKGQANMLAAARGVKPLARPVAPKVPVATPQQEKSTAEGDLFDSMMRSASSAMRSAR